MSRDTMDDQERVTFYFGRELEVQYLARIPSVGDHVTHDRDLWVVTEVEKDGAGPVVICERASSGGAGIGERGVLFTTWQ